MKPSLRVVDLKYGNCPLKTYFCTELFLFVLTNMPNIRIRQASPEECYRISVLIPEFSGSPYGLSEYISRTRNKRFVGLIAQIDGQDAGFKIGYESDEEDVFYSWMGGVLPMFRNSGAARALAAEQEMILKEHGFRKVRFKTRNYLKPMLVFALKNGFDIVQIEERPQIADYRIHLEKQLDRR